MTGREFRVAATLALAAVLEGCTGGRAEVIEATTTAPTASASEEPPTPPSPDVRSELQAALDAWSDFPADADPRPIVPLEEVFGASGWASGDAKVAFGTGNWAMPRTLPESPRTYEGFPVTSARRALNRLRQESEGAKPEGDRLTVSDMRLLLTDVRTDRGTVRLPAWRVLFEASRGPNYVLAVAPQRRLVGAYPPFWLLGEWTASPADDGNGLTVTAPSIYDSGFGGGPCKDAYTVAVAESAQAVAVHLVERPGAAPQHGLECHEPLTYAVTLAAPFGDRVLVGVNGADSKSRGPVPVTAASQQ